MTVGLSGLPLKRIVILSIHRDGYGMYNLCLDKGYDNERVRDEVLLYGPSLISDQEERKRPSDKTEVTLHDAGVRNEHWAG